MCGIGGIISPDPAEIRADVAAMMRAMVHRGPDDEGYEQIEIGARGPPWLGLGFRRLSIQDLSTAGHQPMTHPRSGDWIVFNGEVYNFHELRRELEGEGDHFRGGSDTEVLLAALVRWGEGALARLDGMFAFAWFRADTRRLLLARDPSGIKPLYWVACGQRFGFASEIKALSELPWLDRRLDLRSLLAHVSLLYAPGDATMFAAVRKLPAGRVLLVDERCQPEIRRYAPLPYRSPPDITDPYQAASQCRAVLEKAVTRQLVADVRVGGFLSGGIDSSAIACFAAKHVGQGGYPAFTMRLGDLSQKADGFVDDLPHASLVARQFGLPLHVVTASPDLRSQTDRMVWQLDEPIGDPAALNVWYLCEAARDAGVTVLLSGAGADDIFTGYRRHTAWKYGAAWGRLPASLRGPIERVTAGLTKGLPVGRRLERLWRDIGKPPADRLLGMFTWLDGERARELLSAPALEAVGAWRPEDALRATVAEVPPTTDPLNKMLHVEQAHFLADHNLVYTDKMSMAHGVEVRVPFLAPEVVGFAERCAPHIMHRGLAGKNVLRDAMRGLLPRRILTRPKTGFGVNLRAMVMPLVRERLLSEPSSGIMSVLDRNAVEALATAHEHKVIDAAYPLYALVCVDSWIRQFRAVP
jgi:asparagine synthase (glutamine-hydrolysing)